MTLYEPLIVGAQRRIDNCLAEAGLVPFSDWRVLEGTGLERLWIRLYQHTNGTKFSMAFTDDDLLLPPDEFGLMLISRTAQAGRNALKEAH